MLCWETVALSSEIHVKHINALCGQKVGCFELNLVIHKVTTGLQMVKT